MTFHTLTLTDKGIVSAKAEGHPTDVIEKFHSVASLLLSGQGPWRITKITGRISATSSYLDSQMLWELEAKLKVK